MSECVECNLGNPILIDEIGKRVTINETVGTNTEYSFYQLSVQI
jgi:hypothetical protein